MTRAYPFALDDLADRLGLSIDGAPGRATIGGLRLLAELTGVNVRHLRRIRHRGLSWLQADRFAVVAGFHPAEVWGEAWWLEAAPELFAPEPAAVAS